MSRARIRNDETDGLQRPGIFPTSVVKTDLKLQGPPSPGSIQGRRIAVRVRLHSWERVFTIGEKNLSMIHLFPFLAMAHFDA